MVARSTRRIWAKRRSRPGSASWPDAAYSAGLPTSRAKAGGTEGMADPTPLRLVPSGQLRCERNLRWFSGASFVGLETSGAWPAASNPLLHDSLDGYG